MVDHSSASDRERPTASPWPILVAVGLVCSEVGIIVDLLPVAAGGLVLFAVSVAGFLAESSHISSSQPLVIGFGLVFVLAGSVLYALGTGILTGAAVDGLTGLTSRGLAIAVAGVGTVGVGLVRY